MKSTRDEQIDGGLCDRVSLQETADGPKQRLVRRSAVNPMKITRARIHQVFRNRDTIIRRADFVVAVRDALAEERLLGETDRIQRWMDHTLWAYSRTGESFGIVALVHFGASPKPIGDSTPLIEAAACGHIEAVRMLLKLGLDVNAFNGAALTRAVLGGHLEMVRYLSSAGVDVNAGDGEALGWARKRGPHGLFHALIAAGAKPRTKGEYLPWFDAGG